MKCNALVVIALLASIVSCQQDPPVVKPPPPPVEQPAQPDVAQDPAAAKLIAQVQEQFQKEGITFDAKQQTLSIKAVVNSPRDPIEYLLVHRRGKRHEAMFWTNSKASVLNAAMLMLGLEQGKNATYAEKDPPPTLDDIEKGVDPLIITPPAGKPFWMTVKWQTAEKEDKEYCVEDLLLDITTEKPVTDCQWVYLGGRMAQLYKNEPEVFVADFEGNMLSVCYLTPDNHLGTMAHERGRDDQNWWKTELLPAPETEVVLVFHKQKPKLCVEREQRLAAEKEKEKEPAKEEKKEGGEQQGR